nr:hypothetical protein [Tanacetum cinerariifolium]
MTCGFGVHGNMGCWGSGMVLFRCGEVHCRSMWGRRGNSEKWAGKVAILEKTEHNTDFHQIVDFLEASRIRVETTDAETKILAQVNDRQRTVSKSSIRRHLKLNDEEDETAFPLGDVRYREAFPTDTSLDASQDRENIAKTSAMPHEALPRVTSLCGGEGRGMDQGEDLLVGDTMKDSDKSADKRSDSIDEMSHVLGSLRATNILASGGLRLVFTTASPSVATASIDISSVVTTASGSFPIAAIFTTASVATPTSRLDRSNEMIAKYLSEYEQAVVGLLHDEKVELINELLMYQRHLAQIKKYQAQQNKPTTKTERRNFYMSILRSNVGWKAKDFKGMTFEQIKEKFIPVWEKMQDFMPMNSKIESKRLKRPGIQLDKERCKKLKTTEASGTEPSQEQHSEDPKELSREELKKMMELVPVEELYIEALQVKYPIKD